MINPNANIEAQLVERLRHGDQEAFSLLFRQHYEPLCYFAVRYVRDFNTAESLVQGVFVKLWDGRNDLHIQSTLKGYLYAAVKNSCLNHIKHERLSCPLESVETRPGDADRQPDVQLESDDIAVAVQEAINKLPPKQREILSLAKYDGLSYQEIAEMQKISVNTVKTQLKRAVQTLSQSLQHLRMVLLLLGF